MSKQLREAIYEELSAVTLIDPHTHIDARKPASETLADILGYHYYTELAHSAGMPKDLIEGDLDPKEKVARLMEHLGPVTNTIQYSWLVEMAQQLLGFEGDQVTAENWEPLYDQAVDKMAAPDWAEHVLRASKLDAVFLTNDFDDPLDGFDTQVYIPCLRTDELVFHLANPEVRQRLERATGHGAESVGSLRSAIGALFDHFARKGAKACAISLPPDFSPAPVSDSRAANALLAIHQQGLDAAASHRNAAASFVFWNLAQRCSDYRLPLDLMIGVNRGVYEQGVHQGRDLYDSRVSLIQYQRLFNAFPEVTFPVSVLASVTNQELASYAWIFPNVVTNGHWWYSNTPAFIEHDAAARLEAVPRTKQIGYYSDMYKLEFALPKFNMYKRILAKILAERFVVDRGWSESQAVELGLQVLRDNTERVFRAGQQDEGVYLPPADADEELVVEPADEPLGEEEADAPAAGDVFAGAAAGVAAAGASLIDDASDSAADDAADPWAGVDTGDQSGDAAIDEIDISESFSPTLDEPVPSGADDPFGSTEQPDREGTVDFSDQVTVEFEDDADVDADTDTDLGAKLSDGDLGDWAASDPPAFIEPDMPLSAGDAAPEIPSAEPVAEEPVAESIDWPLDEPPQAASLGGNDESIAMDDLTVAPASPGADDDQPLDLELDLDEEPSPEEELDLDLDLDESPKNGGDGLDLDLDLDDAPKSDGDDFKLDL